MRDLLFSIAYRMLGSVAEAEDVVQEAYLRLSGAGAVANERAFMTTVVTRLAIDVLRSARVRREAYVGEWLPEPLVEPDAPGLVEAEESVSLAMLVLLERLSPVERAVFVLRESFDFSFAEIAEIVERSEDNCRQILVRARRRVGEEQPALRRRSRRGPRSRRPLPRGRPPRRPRRPRRAAGAGRRAHRRRRRPSPRPPTPDGRRPAVARALVAFYGKIDEWGVTLHPARVNGQPGFRTLDADGRLVNVVGLDIQDGRITAIRSMLNPDKLGHLGETSTIGLRPSYG